MIHWTSLRFKTSVHLKNNIKRVKKASHCLGEDICGTLAVKEVIARTYTEFLQINVRQPNRKMAKTPEQVNHKRDYPNSQ